MESLRPNWIPLTNQCIHGRLSEILHGPGVKIHGQLVSSIPLRVSEHFVASIYMLRQRDCVQIYTGMRTQVYKRGRSIGTLERAKRWGRAGQSPQCNGTKVTMPPARQNACVVARRSGASSPTSFVPVCMHPRATRKRSRFRSPKMHSPNF